MAEKATGRPLRALFLFSGSRLGRDAALSRGIGHDNHFIGMFRLRKHGIETSYLEPEQFVSASFARLWRRMLNIYWVQMPFFLVFFRYDIVFAGSAYGPMLVRALLGIRRPRWIIYDANITGIIERAHGLKRRLFTFAVAHADGIVALSQTEAGALHRMFRGTRVEQGIVFLHEGVDTKYFAPSVRSESGYILSVGLDPSRDFKTVIGAVQGTDIELKVATKPEHVAGMDLPPNVSVRRYPPEEMLDLYARARLVVIGLNMKTDNNDSMGTFAVLEAMACGKTVIATRTKALASYIEDGKTGRFVPARDAQALRNVILELWNAPQTCSKLGKAAREFVVAHADADLFAERLAAYFKRIAATK